MCCGLQQLQRLLNSRLFLSLVITACLSGQPHQLTHIIPPVAAGDQQQQVECHNQTCGGIRISYPFSLASATACTSFSSDFLLECDPKTAQLFFSNINTTIFRIEQQENSSIVQRTIPKLKVLALTPDSIALDVTDARVTLTPSIADSTSCYAFSSVLIHLASFPSPYVLSDDNNLGIFGCASGTVILADDVVDDTRNATSAARGSCDTMCPFGGSNPDCGNQSCCVSPWPRAYFPRGALYMILPTLLPVDVTDCASNYATLFHHNYSHFESKTYGIRLKWALSVSNDTSAEAIKQRRDYACSSNAKLIKVPEVPGYLCSCPSGYKGDGYTQGSHCTDINECEGEHDCIPSQSECHNIEGSYICKCNSILKVGDGRRRGSGCSLSVKKVRAIIISISILCLALLVLGLFLVTRFEWKKRTMKRRETKKCFKENVGDQVQSLLLSGGSRIYKLEELQAATDNFSNDMRLVVGGPTSTMFKGHLKDRTVAAIKKDHKIGDPTLFLNELKTMLQINHRNIVEFLGCCVETDEPLLVYEFVSNETIMENLGQGNRSAMDWKQRLKVAEQTAEALAYLHGATPVPILHRDLKSSNVLLDNHFNAKVAGFGAYWVAPEGESDVVHGSIGYLDPEYLQTQVATENSDVYSFGVLLVELITGLKPIDKHREVVNLAVLFKRHMDEDKLEELIDPRLHVHVDHIRSSIFEVASLALRCLSLHGSERPTMSHVVEQLTLNITSKFPHRNGVVHSSYGAVGAQGLNSNVSIPEFWEPSLTATENMEIPLLKCTTPR